jgi:hypothetical protein
MWTDAFLRLRFVEGRGFIKQSTLLGLALGFLLSLCGCATYRHQVADDFRDTFKVNLGVGMGLYAHVKATSFMDAGIGWGGYWWNAGLEDRYTYFVRETGNGCYFPLAAIPGAVPDESILTSLRMANVRGTTRSNMTNGDFMVNGQLFDWNALTQWKAYGPDKKTRHQIFKNDEPAYTEQPCGFEAGVGLIFIDAHIGFDPVEFCDLVSTMCGRDLLHDNVFNKKDGKTNVSR